MQGVFFRKLSRFTSRCLFLCEIIHFQMARNNRGAEDILDAQNREYHDRLSNKTSFLKGLAYDMEMEVKDHNRLLNGVDDDFESTTSLLGGTINRLNTMIGSGRNNRRFMIYVSLGVVATLFILYLIIGKIASGSTTSSSGL